MKNLALFDFDGTLTSSDTFVPFILHAVPPARIAVGKVVLSPLIGGYKLGLLSASRMRRSLVRFAFRGRLESDLRQAGVDYSRRHLRSVLRPQALERIRWHQSQGDEVVVVSASLDLYLADFCRQFELSLICSELEARHGMLTGRYRRGDCSGPEKARRIRQRYDLAHFADVYAYGDTPEDHAMLRLASKRFYRWQKLTSDPA